MSKFFIFGVLLFSSIIIHSQNKFGRISQADFDLKKYKKDTTASAVVLDERGSFKFKIISNNVFLIKDYIVKIKILNKKGFNKSTIDIPFYHNNNRSEKVYEIQGITHNGLTKTTLKKENIYEVDNTENWSFKRFTMPNVKEGSIIQYTYKIKTPFFFNLDGWDFQSDIPKLYSEFNAEIPGNYYYNRVLYGFLKLDTEEVNIKKDCFNVNGTSSTSDCEVLRYAMKDIPAFDDAEKFMLAPSNYKARLDFELSIHQRFDGIKREYTTSWKDVDNEFKKDKNIGRQLSKNFFFKKTLPENLLEEKDELTKAKKIYRFVQDHYTWNGKYGIYKNIRVKEAFNNKIGNIGEINIALINLLKAAGIKSNLMLTATRNRGLPKKTHPVISDFNYVLAKVEIDEKTYLLDASSKIHPFGILPFRCLNLYGRVMDFKEDSYWLDIIPESKNSISFMGSSKLNLSTNEIKGKIREINLGYDAVSTYEQIQSKTEEEYLTEIENNADNFYINGYLFEKEKSNRQKTVQVYDFTIENIINEGDVFISPIFTHFFKTNPFIKEKRSFPVEFGFPRKYIYSMVIEIPEDYEVKFIPKPRNFILPNNTGLLKLVTAVQGESITIRYQLTLSKTRFTAEAYPFLKEFFKNAVDIENKELIILNKKE